MKKIIFLLFLYVFFLETRYSQQSDSVKVLITGIDTEINGDIIVKLFDSENDWLEDGLEIIQSKFKVNMDSVDVIFTGLDSKKFYGISVLHDEDGDEELDMKFFPPGPAEGVGVSNNQFGFGPPSWSDAKFRIDEIKYLRIKLYY